VGQALNSDGARSGRKAGRKRVCEFSASDLRRDRNTVPGVDVDCLELLS